MTSPSVLGSTLGLTAQFFTVLGYLVVLCYVTLSCISVVGYFRIISHENAPGVDSPGTVGGSAQHTAHVAAWRGGFLAVWMEVVSPCPVAPGGQGEGADAP